MVNSTTNTHIILRRNEQNVKKFVGFPKEGFWGSGVAVKKMCAAGGRAVAKELTKPAYRAKVKVKQTISLTETPVFHDSPGREPPAEAATGGRGGKRDTTPECGRKASAQRPPLWTALPSF